MSSRSLTSALRAVRRLNEPSRGIPVTLARSFSGTAANGLRHTFTETENPELNTVLQTIQEKIIFPAYLPRKQRKLIFDPKKRTYLAQNPVIIEVDGEEHRFSPLDRFTDLPNSKTILDQALKNMKTREDWANLPTLLSGYHSAQIKLRSTDWCKIVRLAGETGNIYEVIECAKQHGLTGFYLTNGEVVFRIFGYINAKITGSNWDAAETTQALKWSQVVLDLLHRPEALAKSDQKFHFSRFIRGMHLFTRACALKVKQHNGQLTDADMTLLKDEAKLVESLWKALDSQDSPQSVAKIPELRMLSLYKDEVLSLRKNRKISGSMYVRILSQNIKGIALARELLGEEAQGLAAVQDALDQHVHNFLVAEEKETSKNWQQAYEQVMSLSEPSVEEKPSAESAAEKA